MCASYISFCNRNKAAASPFSHTELPAKAMYTYGEHSIQHTAHSTRHKAHSTHSTQQYSGVHTVCLPKLSIARNSSNARFYEMHVNRMHTDSLSHTLSLTQKNTHTHGRTDRTRNILLPGVGGERCTNERSDERTKYICSKLIHFPVITYFMFRCLCCTAY